MNKFSGEVERKKIKATKTEISINYQRSTPTKSCDKRKKKNEKSPRRFQGLKTRIFANFLQEYIKVK